MHIVTVLQRTILLWPVLTTDSKTDVRDFYIVIYQKVKSSGEIKLTERLFSDISSWVQVQEEEVGAVNFKIPSPL